MARLHPDRPFLHDGVEILDSEFGRYCEVRRHSRVLHSRFGDYSYCDQFADIANAEIGKFANIAAHVRIGATDHPMQGAALHHFLYRSDDLWDDAAPDADFFAQRHARIARIGHDSWIGHDAQVKPGITVGHGAIIASGAIVTKDVTPYSIVAGTPARVLRLRQPPEIGERLIALAWWDWSHAEIRAALADFRALEAAAFLEKYEG
ncbi:chloramphenicol acetyltransferase [Pseudooceanicola sp.]|uniref:chloramphenicol acetyltransferase n=1 Tax=Pseudooceanicola sp. TaxID=1914328 RepID=UPI00263969BA|nr:chloramphenicol acetyltransferase [Pseudooceanicola sp.]MDF1855547.1 chloramphenicol acetyltransferase [Pseudooceanicola sp.]